MILSTPSVPIYSPHLQRGLDALSFWLDQNHYSAHAVGRILAFTAAEGTPTGSAYLEPEDERGATGAFIRALPAVPYDDPAWDDQTMCLDARMLAEGTHPWPIPTVGDDDRTVPPDAVIVPPELEILAPPRISGGSPEAEPFEPSAEDLADYHAWSEDLDRRRDAEDLRRDLRPGRLADISRALYGPNPFA